MSNSLIEAIYDAPTEAAPWQGVLRQLRMETGASSIMLKFTPRRQVARSQILADAASDHRASMAEYRHEYQFRDPVLYRQLQPGTCYGFDDIVTPEQRARSDYFTNFCQRQDIGHAFYLYLGRHEDREVLLAGSRRQAAGPFAAEKLACLPALYPHLARAARLHCRIEPLTTQHWALSRAVDRAGLATAVIDAAGGVLASHGGANAFLTGGTLLPEIARRLTSTARQERCLLRLRDRDGQLVEVLAEPVPASAPAAMMGAAWQIWLQHLARTPGSGAGLAEKGVQQLAQLYGLSPAEARFAGALLDTADLDAAAAACGLTRESGRTYRKRIMEKVGVRKQAALLLTLSHSIARLSSADKTQ